VLEWTNEIDESRVGTAHDRRPLLPLSAQCSRRRVGAGRSNVIPIDVQEVGDCPHLCLTCSPALHLPPIKTAASQQPIMSLAILSTRTWMECHHFANVLAPHAWLRFPREGEMRRQLGFLDIRTLYRP
jgi:hypothetical protein